PTPRTARAPAPLLHTGLAVQRLPPRGTGRRCLPDGLSEFPAELWRPVRIGPAPPVSPPRAAAAVRASAPELTPPSRAQNRSPAVQRRERGWGSGSQYSLPRR